MSYFNFLEKVITGTEPVNSGANMLDRVSGFQISKEVNILAATPSPSNILQVTGTVLIISQFAEITEVTSLTNLTAAYATLYDGTNTVNLTANGAVLSNAPVGSFFTKDMLASQPYSVNLADQCRLLETTEYKYAGRPFIVTQKSGTNTYIRFHFSSTDANLNFKIKIYFEWKPMDGGSLVFL